MNKNIVSTYLPLYIADVKKGHGSFITLDLCKTENTKVPSLHFWIYLTDWYLKNKEGTQTILSFDSINEDNFKDLSSILLNRKFVELYIKNRDTVELIFDNDFKLILVSNVNCYSEDDDLFMLFDDVKNIVISYSPLTLFDIEKTT